MLSRDGSVLFGHAVFVSLMNRTAVVVVIVIVDTSRTHPFPPPHPKSTADLSLKCNTTH